MTTATATATTTRQASRLPERPLNGPGVGGRSHEGGGAGSAQQHRMNQEREKRVKNIREQDPREELLKYAADAAKDPIVGSAYGAAGTAPRELTARTAEQEEQDFIAEQRKLLDT